MLMLLVLLLLLMLMLPPLLLLMLTLMLSFLAGQPSRLHIYALYVAHRCCCTSLQFHISFCS
jgi:hypothetical protein